MQRENAEKTSASRQYSKNNLISISLILSIKIVESVLDLYISYYTIDHCLLWHDIHVTTYGLISRVSFFVGFIWDQQKQSQVLRHETSDHGLYPEAWNEWSLYLMTDMWVKTSTRVVYLIHSCHRIFICCLLLMIEHVMHQHLMNIISHDWQQNYHYLCLNISILILRCILFSFSINVTHFHLLLLLHSYWFSEHLRLEVRTCDNNKVTKSLSDVKTKYKCQENSRRPD